jgi:hypothetical protein
MWYASIVPRLLEKLELHNKKRRSPDRPFHEKDVVISDLVVRLIKCQIE